MLADEMGSSINLPTVSFARDEFNSLGTWHNRESFTPVSGEPTKIANGKANLCSWRLLLDAGSLQDGENNLAGTAHPSVAIISKSRADSLNVTNGDQIKISTPRGEITLACQIDSIDEGSVWVPRNSANSKVIESLGITSGEVSVVRA
jgi:NADH-quinone oxidoreductase subunit G